MTDTAAADAVAAAYAAGRERAAEARHGGRYITGALAKMERLHPEAFARFQSGGYPAAWQWHLSPSGSAGTGRDTTAAYARGLANGMDAGRSLRPLRLAEAEAMVEWPIYRAAFEYLNTLGGGLAELSPRTCGCGHAFADHQSGNGAWTGFCNDPECECEYPTEGK